MSYEAWTGISAQGRSKLSGWRAEHQMCRSGGNLFKTEELSVPEALLGKLA